MELDRSTLPEDDAMFDWLWNLWNLLTHSGGNTEEDPDFVGAPDPHG